MNQQESERIYSLIESVETPSGARVCDVVHEQVLTAICDKVEELIQESSEQKEPMIVSMGDAFFHRALGKTLIFKGYTDDREFVSLAEIRGSDVYISRMSLEEFVRDIKSGVLAEPTIHS